MKTLENRFWAKVNKNGSIPLHCSELGNCWVWTAAKSNGYGVFGRGRKEEGQTVAHRMSWELHYGPIPLSFNVLHKCDNPSCIRPDHLFIGTQKDNLKDCAQKKRTASQKYPELRQGKGNVKLSEKDVKTIRESYKSGGFTVVGLGKTFGVYHSQICRIINRKSWKWVE